MFKKPRAVFIHVLVCLIYGMYEAIGSYVNGESVYLSFSFVSVRLLQFYLCYLWVFPSFAHRGKLLQLVAGVVAAFGVFTGLRALIEEVVYPFLLSVDNYTDGTPVGYYIADNIYWGMPGVAIAAIAWIIQSGISREKENKQLRQEVIRAELAFLRSQINPHFLYNSLNYIYSLAIPVSEQLAESVLKLSELMRYTLKESADGTVKLIQEVKYIGSYIDMFKMRFGSELFAEFEAEGVTEEQIVPALILIPFVENAFKHGVVNDPQRPVRIKLTVSGNRLTFTVSNKISNNQKDTTSGVGLANIKRRLELIYPKNHELMISNNGRSYKITLNILLSP